MVNIGELFDNVKSTLGNAGSVIGMALGETINAITADINRLIGLFVVPFFIAGFAEVSPYVVYYASSTNPHYTSTLASLKLSGICHTIYPYLLINFKGGGLCQILSFNPSVFAAWYLAGFAIIFLVILLLESITHNG